MIDINFKMYSDANGKDPDFASPTLRDYHRILWSKKLPNGSQFELKTNKSGFYLWHHSELGEYSLGSDAITHSYRKHKSKKWLTEQLTNQVNSVFEIGSTIGGYIVFPNKQVNRKYTINQERGVNKLIDDRFDLTLECIKRFYKGEDSPLYAVLNRYKDYFNLFGDFKGYIDFFLLQDLVDDNYNIKFYLPFNDFQTPPNFEKIEDYLTYKNGVEIFVSFRNKRILEHTSKILESTY